MSDITLPAKGSVNWDAAINADLTNLNTDKVDKTQEALDIANAVSTHASAADPHGDRAWAGAQFLLKTDPSVTNARTPVAHASTHATGGTDALSAASIGAITQAAADSRYVRHLAWVFNVEDYGAVHDAKMVSDGVMATGSAVLTSAAGAFEADIVGKAVMIKGAGPNGVTSLVGTVQSRQSANQITVSVPNASGGDVSNALVIWGTDDTSAIQQAVDAAEAYLAAGHLYAMVWFPSGGYAIAGPLRTTKAGNGQIIFGEYSSAAQKVILEFRGATSGAGVRHWLQTVPQIAGSCLISFGVYSSISAQLSDINANGNPAVICGPNEGTNNGLAYGAAARFSNVLAVIKDLAILNAHSADGITYGAANLFGCANAHIENFGYGTTGTVASPSTDYNSPVMFGSGLSAGLLLPAPGNNDYVVARNVSCGGGYTYGMFLTEHAVVDRYMALYCWAGLVAVGTYAGSVGSVHAMKVLSASIEACTNQVYIMGAGSSGVGPILDIDQLSTESGTPTFSGSASAMPAARGTIKLTGLFGEGGVTVDHPTGLKIIDGQASRPVRTVNSSQTVRVIDEVLLVDASSGPVTLTLISAVATPNVYTVKKIDASANAVTVAAASGETIDGAPSRSITTQWNCVTVGAVNGAWYVF